MSSYDDWVLNFKVNTKPIDDALKKVNKLNQAISNLYGGGSGGGRGSGRGGSSTSSGDNPRRRRMTRTAEERAEIQAYQQDARRTRDLSRAEIQAYNEQERRVRAQNTAARRLAQAEIAAHNEDARRTRDVNRAASNAQSARDTLNRGEQLRRRGINQRRDLEMYNRAGAERNRISGIQQRRDMEMYNRSGTERNRINSIQQMRQYQQAVEAAAERRRIAEIQQRRDMEQYNSAHAQRRFAEIQGNRSTRLSSARESRNYTLNSLEQRARQAGVNIDQTQLGSLRQRISGASSFTQLGTLSAEMRAFRDVTNAAIARQNALNRQMQQSGFAATAFTNSMKNLAASMLGVYAIGNALTNVYERSKELENNRNKLIMGTGSKAEAAKAFGKIKAKAQETGLGINQVTDLYGRIAISAKDSGMDEKAVDSMFNGITTLMVGYGLGPEQQKYVSKAFAQMLSCAA